MNRIDIATISKIALVFFIYTVLNYFIVGITTPAIEGDSVAYHIPIANNIWNREFLNPDPATQILHFYPSIGEVILSFFVLLNIPLNLFNVFAVVLLFFVSKNLGEVFGLRKELAIIFAVSLCLLHLTVRWFNSQVIDIWMAVFFVYTLLLLHRPQNSLSYYLKLGITTGLLIGVKFPALAVALILFICYYKNFLKYLTVGRFILFSVPVAILGISWYIRNILITGNPIYPQGVLFLEGFPGWNILEYKVWEVAVSYPAQMFNAAFGEYTVWLAALLLPLIFIFLIKKEVLKPQNYDLKMLLIIAYLNLLFFATVLHTTPEYNIMVSSFRYSYPAFIPLILATFILAEKYKKEGLISIIAIANLLVLPSLAYTPKILFIFLPLLLIVFNFEKIKRIIGK